MREAHALYELGSPDKYNVRCWRAARPLVSTRSQSPHVENQVARSLPFWRHYNPILQAFFPAQLGTSR